MKKIFGLFIIPFIILLTGCNQDATQPQDNTIFEKITPFSLIENSKNKLPLNKALDCLNLTSEQRLVIDSILREERVCSYECKKEFQECIKTIREEYKTKLEKYRDIEKTDEIKKEIEIIKYEFRQFERDLVREYKLKIIECTNNTFGYIEVILRNDQLTLWNLWKATGKIPCERTKP